MLKQNIATNHYKRYLTVEGKRIYFVYSFKCVYDFKYKFNSKKYDVIDESLRILSNIPK